MRPVIPHGNNNNSTWKTYEIEQTAIREYQHYAQQTLEAIDIMFPGQLERRNGQLPQGFKPDTALTKIETQVSDSIVSWQLANNLIRDVMDHTYTPPIKMDQESTSLSVMMTLECPRVLVTTQFHQPW